MTVPCSALTMLVLATHQVPRSTRMGTHKVPRTAHIMACSSATQGKSRSILFDLPCLCLGSPLFCVRAATVVAECPLNVSARPSSWTTMQNGALTRLKADCRLISPQWRLTDRPV